MENYFDYVPTPEQIQAAKQVDIDRKKRCDELTEQLRIKQELENKEKQKSNGRKKKG